MYHEFLNGVEKHILTKEVMPNQDDAKNDPTPRSPGKEKRSNKNLLPERMRDEKEKDRPKTHPYKFHEYHPLKTTGRSLHASRGQRSASKASCLEKGLAGNN